MERGRKDCDAFDCRCYLSTDCEVWILGGRLDRIRCRLGFRRHCSANHCVDGVSLARMAWIVLYCWHHTLDVDRFG